MNNLSIIVARGKNNEIGRDNTLIWHLPDDLKFFRIKTNGKTIVMGYNTFKSLPHMLPNRNHVVLTHKNISIENVKIFHNKEDVLKYIKTIDDEVFIIGGASIYKLFIDDVDTMYITEVLKEFDADAFFPEFDKTKWEQENLGENENNDIKFKHIKYKRMI